VGIVTFQIIGSNMFIVEFKEVCDKNIILEGRPWIFDGNLIALAKCGGLTPLAAMQFEHASFWMHMYNLPLACIGKTTVQKNWGFHWCCQGRSHLEAWGAWPPPSLKVLPKKKKKKFKKI
jgi:hypothetical protein